MIELKKAIQGPQLNNMKKIYIVFPEDFYTIRVLEFTHKGDKFTQVGREYSSEVFKGKTVEGALKSKEYNEVLLDTVSKPVLTKFINDFFWQMTKYPEIDEDFHRENVKPTVLIEIDGTVKGKRVTAKKRSTKRTVSKKSVTKRVTKRSLKSRK